MSTEGNPSSKGAPVLTAEPPGQGWPAEHLSPATWRASPLATLVLYAGLAFAVAAAIVALEWALGDPLVPGSPPGTDRSVEDAVWHLASAFAIALPARRRVFLWLFPLLALGLDVDHLFGAVLPTVTGRTDHALLFLVVVGAVTWSVQGRTAALTVGAAFLEHVAIDGGSFPWLGPFVTDRWPIPAWVTLALLVLTAAAVTVAARGPSAIARPTVWAAILTVAIIVFAAFLIIPTYASFLSS